MTKARAFWLQGIGQGSILEETLGSPRPGWCKVKAMYSALSSGTERLVSLEQVPPELYEEMRCPYMGGAFPFPVKYGYSLVGRIIEGSKEHMGQIVHILHPHQDHCLVSLEDIYPLPANVPPQRATLASNLETAVNAIWDSQISLGEKALVVGFGIIGSLVARLLSFFPGVDVEIADINPAKRDLARKMGFRTLSLNKSAGSFDIAFHASGSGEGLQYSIDRVGFEGKVIEMSWLGIKRVSLSLGGSFHSQRKSIQSSQVSTVSPHKRQRWDKRRRKNLVFRLLERPEFDSHITHSFSFSQLPDIFQNFENLAGSGLSCLIKY